MKIAWNEHPEKLDQRLLPVKDTDCPWRDHSPPHWFLQIDGQWRPALPRTCRLKVSHFFQASISRLRVLHAPSGAKTFSVLYVAHYLPCQPSHLPSEVSTPSHTASTHGLTFWWMSQAPKSIRNHQRTNLTCSPLCGKQIIRCCRIRRVHRIHLHPQLLGQILPRLLA